jgi:hypothetical protein
VCVYWEYGTLLGADVAIAASGAIPPYAPLFLHETFSPCAVNSCSFYCPVMFCCVSANGVSLCIRICTHMRARSNVDACVSWEQGIGV